VPRHQQRDTMNDKWYRDHRLWLEAFVLVNLGMLTADIYLAHQTNHFREAEEYLPLYFSLVAPLVLAIGLVFGWRDPRSAVWRDLGYFVGWLAIALGLAGVVLHLRSSFFCEHTLKSLVYAAPFAAPLAYTGLGLLLVMNRMVDRQSGEWPYWVILMALGGFLGNFVFSLSDHAQNGFFHRSEWIAVFSSALAVGFLSALFFAPASKPFLWLCAAILVLQAAVGILGFILHNLANLSSPAGNWRDKFIYGAPTLAPLLFADLGILAAIGLVILARQVQRSSAAERDWD
jgi:hypothetical protein